MSVASFLGGTARLVAVLNALAFAMAVLMDHPILDSLWKEQGYCIMNPEDHYVTSHDYCLYVGIVLAGVLKITITLLQQEPGMKPATEMVEPKLKIFCAHTIFHGILAAGLRWGFPANHILSVFLPCGLYLFYSWREWNHPFKGFEYALFPWIVEIPLGALLWVEGIYCSQWVIRVWGHLIFDVYIPLSMLIFYNFCWVRASLTAEPKKAKLS